MSRTLIVIGLLIVAIGFLWPWVSRLPLGHLPGDIVVKRENVSFFFPITTMILVSAVVSAVLWLINR
ncbi:DUF2905 domain-containing protein [Pseudomonas asuensis]|uniref:DUF2905 domain-containing protein n=1 Tax=Pseudomonas asuensis TaxID=1825787 RepID=A0ABQ2GSY5_9PSED|nr:DUF2905 domain-containing protein [Pseudomonas asuensis]GGM10414.1 hypothetical protein GCM10009425_21820 [Pseudomonas asuensis]